MLAVSNPWLFPLDFVLGRGPGKIGCLGILVQVITGMVFVSSSHILPLTLRFWGGSYGWLGLVILIESFFTGPYSDLFSWMCPRGLGVSRGYFWEVGYKRGICNLILPGVFTLAPL